MFFLRGIFFGSESSLHKGLRSVVVGDARKYDVISNQGFNARIFAILQIAKIPSARSTYHALAIQEWSRVTLSIPEWRFVASDEVSGRIFASEGSE